MSRPSMRQSCDCAVHGTTASVTALADLPCGGGQSSTARYIQPVAFTRDEPGLEAPTKYAMREFLA
jgi:hypothetical protein